MTQRIMAGFHGSDVIDWCGEYADEIDWNLTLPDIAVAFQAAIQKQFPNAYVEVSHSNGITGLPWQHYAEGFYDDKGSCDHEIPEQIREIWGNLPLEDYLVWLDAPQSPESDETA